MKEIFNYIKSIDAKSLSGSTACTFFAVLSFAQMKDILQMICLLGSIGVAIVTGIYTEEKRMELHRHRSEELQEKERENEDQK